MACGEGYGSRLLSVNARAVTGVDIDAATIQLANEKYKAPNLRFITSRRQGYVSPIRLIRTGDFL